MWSGLLEPEKRKARPQDISAELERYPAPPGRRMTSPFLKPVHLEGQMQVVGCLHNQTKVLRGTPSGRQRDS